MSKLVDKAYVFAIKKHRGQVDDSDPDNEDSYFNKHCYIVGNILNSLNSLFYDWDDNLIAAGYLHDTIEDTDTTYEELVKEFNKDVADLVMEVTHEGSKDQYGYYFPRLKTKRGMILKFADRLSNLSRIDCWDDKRQQQYLNKSIFWKDGSDK